MKYDDESKKGRRSREIEIADEVIEAVWITAFLRSMGGEAAEEMFPAVIRSMVAVTRVVREQHPELPQFMVSEGNRPDIPRDHG
ncbi:hypothetical protein [Rhizobium laguerreae]|uniref:hypothetical protein n=1 Tax=Rhizobium laguerreae TaxID=1076926 RepID=UPI001FE747F3|nr:hypothetical protein [Rhizobium laguerreae]